MQLDHEGHASSSPPSPFIGDRLTYRAATGCRPCPNVRLSGAPLLDLRIRSNADRNAPRLHGLWNFPHELDLQKTILECRTLDFDVVCEIKGPLELARRNTLIQVILVCRCRLASFNGE